MKRLAKDYHDLLQALLHHDPPPKPFMTTQYLIRIVGDLNEQLPHLPVPDDPRGVFYVLKQLDESIVRNFVEGSMSQTERVRLRNELERGRGVVAITFEDYDGIYDVQDAIGRVYERSLQEMEEPFGVGLGTAMGDYLDNEERPQDDIMDDTE